MAKMNPTAGSISKPGQANVLPASPSLVDANPFRAVDGQVIGGLKGMLRVPGSADPQDFGSKATNDGRTVGPDKTR